MKTNMMCLLVLGSLSAFAQNDPPAGQSTPEKSCGLKISSFNIGSGTSFYKSDGTDLNSMKSLASISSTTLFNTPVDGYNLRSNHMFDARQVNLSIGFNPYDSKTGTYNKKRELLVGVTYQWGSRSSLNYSQNTTAVGDTFASGINKIYSDTVKNRTYAQI